MKNIFYVTPSHRQFLAAMKQLENRGAPEAGWVIVYGEAALGKTESIRKFAIDSNALYMRATTNLTAAQLLDQFCKNLMLDSSGSTHAKRARIIAKLAQQNVPIVIDEIDHALDNRAKVLEAVRDITDLTDSTVCLAGMEKSLPLVQRHLQISSRVMTVVKYEALDAKETAKACNELSDVRLAAKVCEQIYAQTKGRMRLIKNAISVCEMLASANDLKALDAEHTLGYDLAVDWTSYKSRAARNHAAGAGVAA